MVKKMTVSDDIAEAIYDCKRSLEKKKRKFIPISKMKNVRMIPNIMESVEKIKPKRRKKYDNIFEI